MLIALLLQAAIATAPDAQPSMEDLVRNLKEVGKAQGRSARCRNLVVEVMRPHLGSKTPEIVQGTSPWERRGGATTAQPPVWVPGANREEGYYAAVDRQIDGCPVPTPIYLPNAK